jgi:hypothetical protein
MISSGGAGVAPCAIVPPPESSNMEQPINLPFLLRPIMLAANNHLILLDDVHPTKPSIKARRNANYSQPRQIHLSGFAEMSAGIKSEIVIRSAVTPLYGRSAAIFPFPRASGELIEPRPSMASSCLSAYWHEGAESCRLPI